MVEVPRDVQAIRYVVVAHGCSVFGGWLRDVDFVCAAGTDILRLNALGTNIIVIDTLKPALELLDKRSAKYSDRLVAVRA